MVSSAENHIVLILPDFILDSFTGEGAMKAKAVKKMHVYQKNLIKKCRLLI